MQIYKKTVYAVICFVVKIKCRYYLWIELLIIFILNDNANK